MKGNGGMYRQDKPRKGKHEKLKLGKKKVGIYEFFESARSRYEVMPNSPWTVLPFRSKAQTHAAYVLKTEFAGPEYTQRLLDQIDNDQEDEIRDKYECHADVFGEVFLKCDEVVEEVAKYRYGNSLLGVLDPASPEKKDVAKLACFREVWQSDLRNKDITDEAKCSSVKVRSELPFTKCPFCKRSRTLQLKCRDEKQRRLYYHEHRNHLEWVRLERETYYANRKNPGTGRTCMCPSQSTQLTKLSSTSLG
jgi:hypothetical protein